MEISHRGPKWIPSYVLRAPVDGGPVHVAGWVGGLFGNAEVIDYPNFAYQMQGLPFTQPFSAPQSAMAANVPSEASLRQCWVMLGGDVSTPILTTLTTLTK